MRVACLGAVLVSERGFMSLAFHTGKLMWAADLLMPMCVAV